MPTRGIGSLGPGRLAVIVKLSPLEEWTSLLTGGVACMAHPHVPASRFLLLQDTTEYSRYTAFATRRIFGMEAVAVMAIRDVDALVASNWVRINSLSWMYAMLPG